MSKAKHKPGQEHLSASSRFNIRFMKRTNLLAIAMFSVGILYKLIEYLVSE